MRKKRILIIDDSPVTLEIAWDSLYAEGYDVYTALNGIEANHIIYSADSRPDLIILDIMMPMLSGSKKAHLLKLSEQTKDIPILFISSKPEAELKQLALDSGVNGYICKPFTKHGLLEAVRNILCESPP
jgi:DNA-binding response OmpR family regulator